MLRVLLGGILVVLAIGCASSRPVNVTFDGGIRCQSNEVCDGSICDISGYCEPADAGDAGPPGFDAGTLTTDTAYWAMIPGTCFHYDDGSGQNEYTTYISAGPDAGLYDWRCSQDTRMLETYTFGFQDHNLVQYGFVDTLPGQDAGAVVTGNYAPPPVWFVANSSPGSPAVRTDTVDTQSDPHNSNVMLDYSYSTVVEEIDSIRADGLTINAALYDVTISSGIYQITSQVWITPGLGIVQFDNIVSTAKLTLKSVQQNVASDADCHP